MKVVRAKSAGFCFGVKNAVGTAYKMIENRLDGERLIMLGELTHNEIVTRELLAGGFEIIDNANDIPEEAGSSHLHSTVHHQAGCRSSPR